MLGAAIAGSSLAAVSAGLWVSRPRAGSGTVLPLTADRILGDTAVAVHPTFRTTEYGNVDAWFDRLDSMGIRTIRGRYDPDNAGARAAVEACRRHGIGWIMTVVPEAVDRPTDQSITQTSAIVEDVAASCADVCRAIEGLNEPNSNRSIDGSVTADWAADYALPHQRAIWEAVRAAPSLAHVEVIGPSLSSKNALRSYSDPVPPGGPQHFNQLAATGIADFQDRVGVHSYPAGGVPLTGLSTLTDLIRAAFGADIRMHLTETGYTNVVDPSGASGGATVLEGDSSRAASEAAVGAYVGRAFLQLAALGMPAVWYELLDDVGAETLTDPQAHYGLWRVPTSDPGTWTPKPAALALSTLMATLDEPAGGGYTPSRVEFGVDAPRHGRVRSVVTARRDGLATAHLFRDLPVWDPRQQTAIAVDRVSVTLRDRVGDRELEIGPEVTHVDLR